MHRLFDPFLFALERLWQHRVLVFWTLLGLSAATTLALSLTLYVDAVNTTLLAGSLDDPPYTFRFRYLGSWESPIAPADVERATGVIQSDFAAAIGTPVLRATQFTGGGNWNVTRQGEKPAALGSYTLGVLEGTDAQMRITAGEWPPESYTGDALPVMMAEKLLLQTGLQVGDTLTAARAGAPAPLTLEVVAMWTPVDSGDPAWILTPKFFDQVFLLRRDDLATALEGIVLPIEEVDWQVIFDGAGLRTSDVDGLLGGIIDGQRIMTAALPGIRLDLSPEEELRAFNEEVDRLTQQLVIVVLPVAGLILYFVTMLADMLVGRQQQEDVTLSSRGMKRRKLLGLHTLLWVILAGVALCAGMVVSPAVVQLIGRTASFLRFDADAAPLDVVFTREVILAGALTGLLAASAGLRIAWRTTGQSINTFRRAQARSGKAWWQRMYLDLMLLAPALYILYTLQAQGGLATGAQDPFSDPLVFLAPTLFSLGFTLLFLRIYPFLLNQAARLIALSSNIALLMALRELTRSIGRYRGTLLMMCFTLSLIGFTASMASTLDRSLEDVIEYQVGAERVLVVASEAQTEEAASDDGSTTLTVTGYNTLPASNLLEIDGVYAVSRVGRYETEIVLPSQRAAGTVLGIDREAIAAIAYFREDYAGEPLADLLNRLWGHRTGVLLSAAAAETYNLKVGQTITLRISALNEWYETEVPVMGVMDYFPTLDPREGFFAVTNIDPIFELVGTELPHNIWLRLAPGADGAAVLEQVQALGFPVLDWLDPAELIAEAQAEPTRRGVLGFLSVGFVAAILLTLVGSVIQSTASFRAQAVQIGSLRAMGLSALAVGAYLLLSQGIAALGGIAGGTLIGMLTTLLFLPLLDFSGGLPPYLVRVAWNDITLVYGVFAAVLFGITVLTTVFLSRQQVSTLVKLGDA
ncbi:MAG: ABC transporter permease [Anaerolineae bacterium]|nr:ABC transporter permease [Anaerolineae bacterium]